MINLTREEAQQVLDAFLGIGQRAYDAMSGDAFHECSIAVSRLRFRLAQPEPEPIAYKVGDATVYIKPPIYTAPPQREWQGLTDEDVGTVSDEFLEGALWAEAKLKEKNT
jgi:hypothetical protein